MWWSKRKSDLNLADNMSEGIVSSQTKIGESVTVVKEEENKSPSSNQKELEERVNANTHSNDLSEDESRDNTEDEDLLSYVSSESDASSNLSGDELDDDDDFIYRLSLNDPSLTEVDISLGHNSVELCKDFSSALAMNYHLKVLTLVGDDRQMARTKMVSSLSYALARNTSLETVEIRDAVLSRRCALALGMAIGQSKSIQALKLSNCVFNDTACSLVFLGVQHSSTIETLEIRSCNLKGIGLDIISATVSLMKIKQLCLDRTMLTLDGLNLFCEQLHLNEHLEELDLSHNTFGLEESKVLAATLKSTGQKLKSIHLDACGLDNQCVKVLSKAFAESSSLQKISLSKNQITNTGAKILKSVLEQNSNILEMNVSGNNISSRKKTDISDNIRVNNSCLKSICHHELSIQILDAMDMCCSSGKH